MSMAVDPEISRYFSLVGGLKRRYRDLSRLGGCSQPIRVRGELSRVDTDGVQRKIYSTRREIGGVMLVACGNRRASRCPSCSEVYRADTFHLIRAGLLGGDKGVPETVREHPRALVTLTAPSFGPVHAHRTREDGTVLPCRPRRSAGTCPHGKPLSCTELHGPDDVLVGQPLCAECYDYDGHALWNAHAPDLWRRFTIYLRRELAYAAGMTAKAFNAQVRVSFAKVAEYQARGIVHFHAVVRLDGRSEDNTPLPPPDWATVDLLDRAARTAAASVHVDSPHCEQVGGVRRLVFGSQVDIKPIVAGELTEDALTEAQVAGYIAKYATKGATTEGTVDRRIKDLSELNAVTLTAHQRRLIETCWHLGDLEELKPLRLRGWAHMLGFRGHFSTKSGSYSTTLGKLRDARRSFRARQAREHGHDALTGTPADDSTLVVGSWRYAGQGYTHPADLYVAQLIREEREERRRSRWPVAAEGAAA
ncbi:replication initiation protein [Microbispora hainanensis]|uniref:Replication initiation protein n=2 Tax=Streptosporangiaceae TaxID=2004 RepID=A0ABZ1SMI6_9ACTN|nr:replication initiator [Microbispora sp. CL1-1]NJP27830.1 replication initiation protein [Microbispora sp. CL1-1]TQS10597.1 replication initiation protein [Microbispora sp. SCL1-1]